MRDSQRPIAALVLATALSSTAFAGTVPDQALAFAAAGQYRKALPLIEPLAQAHPDDAELRFRHGEALAKLGRTSEAVAELRAAIALDPANGLYHRVLGDAFVRDAEQSDDILHMLRLVRAIEVEYRDAVRLAPDDLEANVRLADFYIMAPRIVGGGYDKAHPLEATIARLDRVAGLKVRAREASHKDDHAGAEALLRQAIRLDPTAGSLVALGFALIDADRLDDAIQAFRDATAKDPLAYEAWYQIGRVAGIAETDHDEGIRALQRYLAFEDRPDTEHAAAWARLRLGNLYEQKGDEALARVEYGWALEHADRDDRLAQKAKDAAARVD
jgi:tetratricopeptide (TPR) repeat protein